MLTAARNFGDFEPPVRLATRGELTAYLMSKSAEVGAENYMLLGALHRNGRKEGLVLASNWTFDLIELAGVQLLGKLTAASTSPGAKLTPISCMLPSPQPGPLTPEEKRLLDVSGHGELFALALHAGRRRLFLILSHSEPGMIDAGMLAHLQLDCCYDLSDAPHVWTAATADDTLSDRERECLLWVCEGKTTDAIAVILSVSSNTVGAYLTSAIQKLSASNRTMAVATAIRGGLI